MSECEVCYQAILQSPRQCFACGASIQPGHKYRYRDAAGVCEPVHDRCYTAAKASAAMGKALTRPRTFVTESQMLDAMDQHGDRGYDDFSEEGRLL